MSGDYNDQIKPKLFAMADALGINLSVDRNSNVKGTGKRDLTLFEGYSPTVISDIESGTIDTTNETIMTQGRIWGNLGFVCVVERTRSQISFFVYDRSKTPENSNCTPFEQRQWSRKRLYYWLEKSVRAVYYRSMFDTEWAKLENGPSKIKDYNHFRDQNMPSREAYETVWGEWK